MADTRAGYGSSTEYYGSGRWEQNMESAGPYVQSTFSNHDKDGLNILYVGGHAKWIAARRISGSSRGYLPKEAVPNCLNTSSCTNPCTLRDLHPAY
jgi:prepilin-type processing-associated H-X9-DG protein